VASDEHAFSFSHNIWFSALSLNYPLDMADNLGAIIYFDCNNKVAYNFINWNHKFRFISLYFMAYWNPEKYNLPQQGYAGNSYAGPGVQLMVIYNH
jgi:hypothetical protein